MNGMRPLLTLRADDSEDRGQQRHRGEHGDRHHDGRGPAHHRHHRDTRDLETGDGDDDRGAGEQHRESSGRVGLADRDGDGGARLEVLAVPGQDEQRVVDADTEAEHHADDGGDLGNGDDSGEEPIVLMPISRPISATTIGRLMATSEPKATARTTMATRMPIFSLLGASASPLA